MVGTRRELLPLAPDSLALSDAAFGAMVARHANVMATGYRITTTSKIGAIAAGVVLLAVLGFFLAFGFVLVSGLVVAGMILGLGAAIRRRMTGRAPDDHKPRIARYDLDPAKEVRPAAARPVDESGDRLPGQNAGD